MKIIDLILFVQTAPKRSRGESALLLCQWLMCRLYYIFWLLRGHECKDPAVYLIFSNGQEFIFVSSLSNLCLPLHRTCKPSKIYDIVAIFYGPNHTIYSQFRLCMVAHILGMKKESKQMLAQQCINNRSHHRGSCHYLLGKLSSCSSAVVSGNKLMCCGDYTESDRNIFSQDAPAITVTHMHTRAHWACNVRTWRSQNELNAIIMCYHLHQLFISSFYWGLHALSFPPSSPLFCSQWRGGHTKGGFSFLHIHICQFHWVKYRERSIQLDNLSIIIIVLLMLGRCLSDVMVWHNHARHNISWFVLQIPLMSVSFCQEYRKD